MTWLILGLLLWSGVHFFPALLPVQRTRLMETLGNKYQGLFALSIIVSLALIVFGWRSSIPNPVYNPPVWGRHLTMLLVLVAVILFAASHGKTRLKQYVRHPMLTAVAVWAVAHLLANGDTRSVTLFSALLVWALVSQFLINRRDGAWVKPAIPRLKSEIKVIGIGLVAYLVLMVLHPYFAGVAVLTR